ncbi:GNAT family N-acetyltransferase [Actibacterium sp. 188UL27-1]|uniref:GNAT family N-acetyltransferase n=1 Tax=Actibacterium sp. 188UL27-1 TaxID=2786961 RepID=UPI0019586E63|nr:GNAT family N-acetyltransferase [Actibacterium sp. 188UL27-1]MBM7068638.1 GNAT family N-acetyltransferase [Actibacterium sp. 188UL27-1]
MTILIRRGDPWDPAATALLQASHVLMERLFPAEANHYLSLDALTAPAIHFFVAEHDGQIKGCAALAEKAGYGEVKSMFVDPEARGLGIGDALIAHLIEAGQALRMPVIRLETGDALHAAHRLYERHGFQRRGVFGDYKVDPTSLFMERAL